MIVASVRGGRGEQGPSGASEQGNAEMGRLARAVSEIAEEHSYACVICRTGTRCGAATLLWRCVAALQAQRSQVLGDGAGRCQRERSQ